MCAALFCLLEDGHVDYRGSHVFCLAARVLGDRKKPYLMQESTNIYTFFPLACGRFVVCDKTRWLETRRSGGIVALYFFLVRFVCVCFAEGGGRIFPVL